MVLFYTIASDEEFIVYAGKDKFENEDLIKYGWPEDVWFHVDNLSSPHVYLRLPEGYTIKNIPENVMEQCSQLVKGGSISGSKLKDVMICYTLWSNLHKRGDMDVGTIGFHEEKEVYKRHCTKEKILYKKIKKTEEERHPDLKAEREARDKEEQAKNRATKKAHDRQKRKEKEAREKQKLQDSYQDGFFDESQMQSNQDMNMTAEEYEDNFFWSVLRLVALRFNTKKNYASRPPRYFNSVDPFQS